MFYVKNLPVWERWMRAIMAMGAVAASYSFLGLTPVGLGADAMAVMVALTGVFGFCPACAMVGRKLKSGSK